MRTWLLVIVVAAAGAAAWVLLRDSAPTGASEGSVERAGEAPREGPQLQGRAGPAAKPVPRGHLAIEGKALLSSGKAAAGATVSAALDRVGEVARVSVAADGSYRLEGLTKGLHRLEARLVDGDAEYGAEGWVGSAASPTT